MTRLHDSIIETENRPRRWYDKVRNSRPDRFQELEFLLKAVDRFLDVSSFSVFKKDMGPLGDFRLPLKVVLDGVLNLLGVLEAIIPESQRNLYWFQRYAGNKYLPDERKDRVRQQFFEQGSEEQSLLLLYDSFVNVKGIVAEILKADTVGLPALENVGEMIRKEIRVNAHFNPFQKRKMDPVVDGIHNPALARLVNRMQDPAKRRLVARCFLSLFRVLRYLEYVDAKDFRFSTLNVSLLAMALIHSELTAFHRQFGQSEPPALDGGAIEETVAGVGVQLKMEMKRVFSQELKGALEIEDTGSLRGRVENAHGILKNVLEHSVVGVAQTLDPSLLGEQVFASFTTRSEQSAQLREDLMVLFALIEEFEEDLTSRRITFGALLNYLLYFENNTFKLLRYNDYEGFVSFFSWFKSVDMTDLRHRRRLEEIKTRLSYFKIYLETTLQHIGLRSELAEIPSDPDRIDWTIRRYLPERERIVFRLKK